MEALRDVGLLLYLVITVQLMIRCMIHCKFQRYAMQAEK